MRRIQKLFYAVAIFSCFTLGALANPQTTTFTLTGVQGPVMGGVYTSPYVATINGTSGINVICDDFTDDSYVPETWTTYVTNLSTVTTSSPVKWIGSGYGSAVGADLSQANAYATAAYLAEELLNVDQSTTEGQIVAGEYSFAMWALFDPTAFGSISGDVLTAAQSDLTDAISHHGALSSYSNVTLYSYDSIDSAANGQPNGCNGACPPPPQEFIVVKSMAEPSSPAILGMDLLGVAGFFFVLRRRMIRTAK